MKGKLCRIYVNGLARPALDALFLAKSKAESKGQIAFTALVKAVVKGEGLWVTETRVSGKLVKSKIFVPYQAIAFVDVIESN